jgi:RNA dependent RNA polymerase
MALPSAFQFRLGGAKGVLTLTTDTDDRREIQLRPSQIKFNTEHSILEVIRPSNYIPLYLNRQAITILSSLGVSDGVFLDMVTSMLSSMNRMLSNAPEAIRILQANVDEYGTAKSMAHILSAGFLERKDPYILNLLNLFRMSQLKDLKKKAKIIVPQGAYLLGVMDETNSLKENEVFVQISAGTNDSKNHRQIIVSDCILFRNPCFHPGDIRVVQAVDYPALHHLVNVIVFPAQGYRDLASMCSGGDLDGDDYR